jgi:hypothetical protein
MLCQRLYGISNQIITKGLNNAFGKAILFLIIHMKKDISPNICHEFGFSVLPIFCTSIIGTWRGGGEVVKRW